MQTLLLHVTCIGCVCIAENGDSCDGVTTSLPSAAFKNDEKIIETEVSLFLGATVVLYCRHHKKMNK